MIASNPPYIATGQLAGLPREVQAEPRAALDGGPDGLAVVRRLIADAAPLLPPGGALIFEIGADQGAAVRALVQAAGRFEAHKLVKDLAGCDRVVVATLRAADQNR